jgi:hypothetical protein
MKAMTPNLKKLYGKKYRIDYERFMGGAPINRQDPWTMLLKSSIGHVYIHSETHLGFATDGNARSLRKVPELELMQDGDHGQNYIFPVALLPQLAKVLKLRKRRQVELTEEQREILRQRMKGLHAQRRETIGIEQKIDALKPVAASAL